MEECKTEKTRKGRWDRARGRVEEEEDGKKEEGDGENKKGRQQMSEKEDREEKME